MKHMSLLIHQTNGKLQGRRQWYGRYGRMAVPVFEGEKNGVAWILTCVIEWPLRAVRRSLGHLRGLYCTISSLQASKVATRELRLLNNLSARRARKLGRG